MNVRVLVIFEKAAFREQVTNILSADEHLKIVAFIAIKDAPARSEQHTPDLILIEASGKAQQALTLTKQLMINAPHPIALLLPHDSTFADQELTRQAIAAGAVSVVKSVAPNTGTTQEAQALCQHLRSMAAVKVVRHWSPGRHTVANSAATGSSGSSAASSLSATSATPSRHLPPVPSHGRETASAPCRVVAIAASTGGPAALQQVLSSLPADFPLPILVVQHITSGFTDGLVSWLSSVCSIKVKVAVANEPIAPRTVYLAPDQFHLGTNGRHQIMIADGPAIKGFRPSANFLFSSVAKHYGATVAAVIMTGMGSDGVDGLAAVKQAGGQIIAQDESSSVVFGMPAAAIEAGLADKIVPLDHISQHLIGLA